MKMQSLMWLAINERNSMPCRQRERPILHCMKTDLGPPSLQQQEVPWIKQREAFLTTYFRLVWRYIQRLDVYLQHPKPWRRNVYVLIALSLCIIPSLTEMNKLIWALILVKGRKGLTNVNRGIENFSEGALNNINLWDENIHVKL
jgi:hypothetical protein